MNLNLKCFVNHRGHLFCNCSRQIKFVYQVQRTVVTIRQIGDYHDRNSKCEKNFMKIQTVRLLLFMCEAK